MDVLVCKTGVFGMSGREWQIETNMQNQATCIALEQYEGCLYRWWNEEQFGKSGVHLVLPNDSNALLKLGEERK